MSKRNKTSDGKEGRLQKDQMSLEITHFNWYVTDLREKLGTESSSPSFSLKSDNNLKMCIIFGKEEDSILLHTSDNTETALYYLGVEFKIDVPEYKFAVPHAMKFSVGKLNNNLISKSFMIKTKTVDKKDYRQYITDFITKTELLKCLTVDGCLEIRLKVTPFIKTDIDLDGNSLTKTNKNFDGFLNSRTLSDVVFHIGKSEFPAHKIILASASPVFARMFSTEMKENITNIFEVREFHPNVFNEMLRYIYTSKIENLKSVAFDLYRLADKYDISGLKASCENYLVNNLSDENVIKIFEMADWFNSVTLKEECVVYIDANFDNVKKTVSFKNIKKDLLIDLFCTMRENKKQRTH